jgi:hypothetical protein
MSKQSVFSWEERNARRQLFNHCVKLDIESIIQNGLTFEVKTLSHKQISKLL